MPSRYARRSARRQDRKLLGLCAAIANSMGVEALWVRIATIALVLFVSPLFIVAYLAGGWAVSRGRRQRQHRVRDEARYIAPERRHLVEADMMLTHRNSRLSREIDALR